MRRPPGRQILNWVGLGVLLITAGLVIFLLPRWVSAPAVDSAPSTPVVDRSAGAARANPQPTGQPPLSPWEKAQESRIRRETQELLEQILSGQKLLEERGVTVWAEAEHEQALEFARQGDELYNQLDYRGARDRYEQALHIVQDLQERVDEVFADAMERGEQALADGDSAAAIEAFDLALAIDSIDRAATQGRARADTLDAVLSLVRKGDRLLQDEQPEEARQAYREALELDDQAPRARQQIAAAEQLIEDRAFKQQMSEGFAALYDGRPESARKAFTRALEIKPASADARSALQQSNHQITARSIESLILQAETLETEERWHEALAKYEAALKLDSALATAQAGRARSALRAQTSDRLDQILAQPERLYDADVLRDALAFHERVSALSDPGPVLSRQLDRTGELLEKMRAPVTIELQSDNQTRVTLHKVGELGSFESREVRLRPGRYVAVGSRDGYRDVRVEFIVDPDKPAPSVTIRADEKITFG
ncbi:MAG: hypothetical protein RQ826_09015 [Xanthomonadales bacterium]|nr:hypothetical protein [Xanthomonadales bacterium]